MYNGSLRCVDKSDVKGTIPSSYHSQQIGPHCVNQSINHEFSEWLEYCIHC